MHSKYAIKLLPEEEALVERIDLQGREEGFYEVNQEPILSLLQSLSDRDGIPEVRRRYWSDPAYKAGPGKTSRLDQFKKHNHTQEKIYTHPHFLPHLRYFLFGPDLPKEAINAFEEQVGPVEYVTSSDRLPIYKAAQQLAKGLDPQKTSEEFFKLALEIGLDLEDAYAIREKIMKSRK